MSKMTTVFEEAKMARRDEMAREARVPKNARKIKIVLNFQTDHIVQTDKSGQKFQNG